MDQGGATPSMEHSWGFSGCLRLKIHWPLLSLLSNLKLSSCLNFLKWSIILNHSPQEPTRVHNLQGSRRLPSLVPLASPSWASLATQWSWSSSPSTTSLWGAAEHRGDGRKVWRNAEAERQRRHRGTVPRRNGVESREPSCWLAVPSKLCSETDVVSLWFLGGFISVAQSSVIR